jgi:hypothetical protein
MIHFCFADQRTLNPASVHYKITVLPPGDIPKSPAGGNLPSDRSSRSEGSGLARREPKAP